jgi:hypothetical protein
MEVRAVRAAYTGCGALTGAHSTHELGEERARLVYRDGQDLLYQFAPSPLR